MNDKPRKGVDIGLVVFEGREYRLYVTPPNCGSQKHWHEEPHADGSPVIDAAGDLIPHHHHDPACAAQPRQGTLYPVDADDPRYERHEHHFGMAGMWDRCACGAERARVHTRKPVEDDGKRLYEYVHPADADHPEGWAWERWSAHE